jgi:hypothetical protein
MVKERFIRKPLFEELTRRRRRRARGDVAASEHPPRRGVSPEGESIESPFSMSLRYAKTET